MPLKDTHTRLSVQVPGHRVDLTIGKDLQIAVLTASIRAYLANHVFADDADRAEVLEFLNNPYAQWQLTSPVGVHYPGDQTMSDLGIYDGSVVVLADSPQRENYAPLIDDTAEALAHYQRRNFGAWTVANARTLTAVLSPLAALFIVAVLAHAVGAGHLGAGGQYAAAGIMLFSSFALLIGGVMARRALTERPMVDAELNQLLAGVLVAGYVFIGGAGLLIVPGKMGQLNLVLGGAMMFGAAAVVAAAARFPENLNFAAMSVGALTAIAAGIGAACHASTEQLSFALAAVAVVYYLRAPRMSLVIGRIKLPRVPAQGESFVRDNSVDLDSFERDTPSQVIASEVNQERNTLTAHGCLVGMCWGAMVLIAACAAVAGAHLESRPVLGFIFFGAVSLAMVYAGKSIDDAVIQRSWLVSAFAVPVLFVGAVALSGRDLVPVIVGVVLVAAAVAVSAFVSASELVLVSPTVKRSVEIVEYVAYAALIPCLIFILGLWDAVRGI